MRIAALLSTVLLALPIFAHTPEDTTSGPFTETTSGSTCRTIGSSCTRHTSQGNISGPNTDDECRDTLSNGHV